MCLTLEVLASYIKWPYELLQKDTLFYLVFTMIYKVLVIFLAKLPGSFRWLPGSFRQFPGSFRQFPGSFRQFPGSFRAVSGSFRRVPVGYWGLLPLIQSVRYKLFARFSVAEITRRYVGDRGEQGGRRKPHNLLKLLWFDWSVTTKYYK